MISKECRKEIFKHLLDAANNQRKVRCCIEEGCIFDMEKDIETMSMYELITFRQEDKIKRVLKKY